MIQATISKKEMLWVYLVPDYAFDYIDVIDLISDLYDYISIVSIAVAIKLAYVYH